MRLVCLDESLLKERIGWRQLAYAPMGNTIPWHNTAGRGASHSVLPDLAANGYLPRTGFKKRYYNAHTFVEWLRNKLLPHPNSDPEPRSVLILNNVSLHHDPRAEHIVNEKGMLLKFLPPYSPDFNLIELTFNLLKTWMRKYFGNCHGMFHGDYMRRLCRRAFWMR